MHINQLPSTNQPKAASFKVRVIFPKKDAYGQTITIFQLLSSLKEMVPELFGNIISEDKVQLKYNQNFPSNATAFLLFDNEQVAMALVAKCNMKPLFGGKLKVDMTKVEPVIPKNANQSVHQPVTNTIPSMFQTNQHFGMQQNNLPFRANSPAHQPVTNNTQFMLQPNQNFGMQQNHVPFRANSPLVPQNHTLPSPTQQNNSLSYLMNPMVQPTQQNSNSFGNLMVGVPLQMNLHPVLAVLLKAIPNNELVDILGPFFSLNDQLLIVHSTEKTQQVLESEMWNVILQRFFVKCYYCNNPLTEVEVLANGMGLYIIKDPMQELIYIVGDKTKEGYCKMLEQKMMCTIAILPTSSNIEPVMKSGMFTVETTENSFQIKALCQSKNDFVLLSYQFKDMNKKENKENKEKKEKKEKKVKDNKTVKLATIAFSKLKYLQNQGLLKEIGHHVMIQREGVNSTVLLKGPMIKKRSELLETIKQLTDFEITHRVPFKLIEGIKNEVESFLKESGPYGFAFNWGEKGEKNDIVPVHCKVALLTNDQVPSIKERVESIVKCHTKSLKIPPSCKLKDLNGPELTKGFKYVFVSYSNKEKFVITGLKEEDVEMVYENLQAMVNKSQTRFRHVFFDNEIEMDLGSVLVTSHAEKFKLKVTKGKSTNLRLEGSMSDLDQFTDNQLPILMKKIRAQVVYDFIPVSHHEYKYWNEPSHFKQLKSEAKNCGTEIESVKPFIKQINCFNTTNIYISKINILDDKLNVDVIVNSANETLSHGGGIAKAISDAAGKLFQDSCQKKLANQPGNKFNVTDVIDTPPGSISHISSIYNAIPPRFGTGEASTTDLQLKQTVLNILKLAEKNSVGSIAIPALSMGIFCYPVERATKLIVEAIEFHLKNTIQSCIREIHLVVDVDDKTNVDLHYSKALVSTNPIYMNFSTGTTTTVEEVANEFAGVFRYFDDIKKRYLDYSVNENKTLCEHFFNDPKCKIVLEAEQGRKYLVDFSSMRQTNQATGISREIIFVPNIATDFLQALWFYKNDQGGFSLYRENQCRAIEAEYCEGGKEAIVPMTNSKYKDEDMVYKIKFLDGDKFVQVNSKTNYEREVKRMRVTSLVQCAADQADCKSGDILYVYGEQDDKTFNCAFEANFFTIPKSDTKPFNPVKTEKKSVSIRQKIFMFKLICSQNNANKFKTEYNALLEKKKTYQTLPLGCSKQIIDNILSKHKSFVGIPTHLFSIDTSKAPFVVKGLEFIVSKLYNKVIYEIANNAHTIQAQIYPSHWSNQDGNLEIVDLPNTSTEFITIETRVKQTLPNVQVLNIERIQNKFLYQSFKNEMDRLNQIKTQLNGSWDCNPVQLFHGTRQTNPIQIYNGQDGFDMRFSAAGMWGQGVYFAQNASYSNGYAFSAGNQIKKFFLSDVLLGDYLDYQSTSDRALRLPPEKQSLQNSTFSSVRYDSVKGFTGGSVVHIVYQNSKAYPSYLITYQ